MPAAVLDAFVADVAGVIAISQQDGYFGGGDRAALVAAGHGHAKAGLGQLRAQRLVGFLAGGEQLKGHDHVLGAFWVGHDGVDFAAVDEFGGVEVADRGAADGAAVAGFVGHFGLDVLAADADLEPVEHVRNGFHGFGHVAVAEVLFGRDKFDAEFGELLFDDGGFDVVAEDPGAHVDDDVVHVALLNDALQQVLEERPLLDGLAGVAGLDVLADVDGAHLSLFGRGYLALGVNGVALGVAVVV